MASIDLSYQNLFWESRSGFCPLHCEVVRVRAITLAEAAGRAESDVVQADYERAIHELSMEAEIETGVL